MSRFKEYNLLFKGQTIGWVCGRRIVKELTHEEFRVLRSLLTHRKARLRWSAADRLGKLGHTQAVESLIKALHDDHWLVRLHAAKALGRIGDQIAIEPLIAIMNDECPYVRRRVVSALARLSMIMNMQIAEVLVSALGDSDKKVRARAAWELRDTVSPSAIAAIVAAVRDPEATVSWHSVDALQKIGTLATNGLLRLLDDPDSDVRYRVIKTLGRIGDQRAVEPLKKMLDDPNEEVRFRANFALRQLGHQVQDSH